LTIRNDNHALIIVKFQKVEGDDGSKSLGILVLSRLDENEKIRSIDLLVYSLFSVLEWARKS